MEDTENYYITKANLSIMLS